MSRLEAEKEELEKELDTQTNQTHKQVKGWYFFIGRLMLSLFFFLLLSFYRL